MTIVETPYLYLVPALIAMRFFGGKWAWHLAQNGTQDRTIQDSKARAAYYRDAMGRPTNTAYVWGLVVGVLAGLVWPLVFFCFFAWKACSNERTQDLLLPGTNEHYEKIQEQHNHLARLANPHQIKALEAEVFNQEDV